MSNVTVLPLTVHTLGVLEVKDTVRPEVELALKAGDDPRLCGPGAAKLTVCVRFATVNDWLTVGAAA